MDTKFIPIPTELPVEKVANVAYNVQQLRAMVRELEEIDDERKELGRRKRAIIESYSDEHNIPKKEVKEAMKMLKSDIDPTEVEAIYREIADLVSV